MPKKLEFLQAMQVQYNGHRIPVVRGDRLRIDSSVANRLIQQGHAKLLHDNSDSNDGLPSCTFSTSVLVSHPETWPSDGWPDGVLMVWVPGTPLPSYNQLKTALALAENHDLVVWLRDYTTLAADLPSSSTLVDLPTAYAPVFYTDFFLLGSTPDASDFMRQWDKIKRDGLDPEAAFVGAYWRCRPYVAYMPAWGGGV